MARETGDSAALSVLDGTEIVYVARASVRTLVRLEAHVGSHFPALSPPRWAACCSRALSPERLDAYFAHAQARALTEQTVTDRAGCAQLIEECRRGGYAAVEDELAYGVVALAVPVFDQAGRVVAALNSSSHSKKLTKAQLVRERLPMLHEASREISRELARIPGLSLTHAQA